MNRIAASLFAVLGLTLSAGPALAAETDNILVDAALLPARSAGLVTGLALGTPIAIVRKTIEKAESFTTSIASAGNSNPTVAEQITAGLVGVPAGIIVGTADGIYCGAKNAIINCVDNPFTAESFSLKELD